MITTVLWDVLDVLPDRTEIVTATVTRLWRRSAFLTLAASALDSLSFTRLLWAAARLTPTALSLVVPLRPLILSRPLTFPLQATEHDTVTATTRFETCCRRVAPAVSLRTGGGSAVVMNVRSAPAAIAAPPWSATRR